MFRAGLLLIIRSYYCIQGVYIQQLVYVMRCVDWLLARSIGIWKVYVVKHNSVN